MSDDKPPPSLEELDSRLKKVQRERQHTDGAGMPPTRFGQSLHLGIEMAATLVVGGGVGWYLDQLLDRIERAAVPDHVSLFREIDAVQLSRETAVAIGLYLNEAISNSLKYAFPDERPGKIGVFFQHRPEGWRLTIDDNGVGIEGEPSKGGGLGSNLLQAFSAQAGARHSAGPTLGGFRTEMNALREAVA